MPYFQISMINSVQAEVVIDHVHEKWGCVDKTINAIENAAVPGNGRAHIFDPDIAFDHANRQIAKLAAHSHNKPGEQQLLRAEVGKRKVKDPWQRHRNTNRPDSAFPRLLG